MESWSLSPGEAEATTTTRSPACMACGHRWNLMGTRLAQPHCPVSGCLPYLCATATRRRGRTQRIRQSLWATSGRSTECALALPRNSGTSRLSALFHRVRWPSCRVVSMRVAALTTSHKRCRRRATLSPTPTNAMGRLCSRLARRPRSLEQHVSGGWCLKNASLQTAQASILTLASRFAQCQRHAERIPMPLRPLPERCWPRGAHHGLRLR